MSGYHPAMCALTIPNLRAYAHKIGADFNLIKEPKFPGFPPNYEKFQVWWAGKDYDWNINVDADTVLHPECEDPTERLDPRAFASLWGMAADHYFDVSHPVFLRDGRNQAIADCFTVSSALTHDVWEPLPMTYGEMSKFCLKDPRQVSEYNLSFNLARYGVKHDGALVDHSKHYSVMATTESKEKPEDLVAKKLAEWENNRTEEA